ncbi:chitosanase [Kitasatospora aureofaciens]|nr:chitosanase [Kitasatospora aureofaciens]MBV6701876.1 chitosanase [Kitasatospora aureofaciens]
MSRSTIRTFIAGAAVAALLPLAGAPAGASTAGSAASITAGSHAAARPSDAAFQHPGVLVGNQQLAFLKGQLDAGAEPWKSAFADLQSSKFASLDWQPQPRATVECGSSSHPNNGCSDERDDAMAAYAHALQWVLTKDQRHAEKAIQIMDAWSGVIQEHTNSNAPLQTGWSGNNWSRAAELIRYSGAGWSAASIDRFSTMLRTVYVPLLTPGSPRKNGNWELIETDALMGIAVFLDDHDLFNQAATMWRNRLPAYIYLSSDGPLPVPPPNAGIDGQDAIVKYWQGQSTFVDGLSQETCRDFGHTGWGLEAAAQTAETARLQGLDLWSEGRERLVKALEFHAAYDNGASMPDWLCDGSVKTGLGPTVQIAFNEYHGREGIAMPQTEQFVGAHSPFGANYFIGWETLTHTSAPLAAGPAWVATSAHAAPALGAVSATAAQALDAGGMTADQRRRADQLISIFENSTTVIQYGYAENINDGRGVTAGRAGFTTNDGDALKVVRAYTAVSPDNPLARFIPELERLASSGSGDTSGLPESDYIAAWKQAADDPAFRQVQDDQVDQRYFSPAMSQADQLGLTGALARAELYDASIQHGNGSEYDALPALISRTNAKVGSPAGAGENAWLEAFFDVRIDDLNNPANGSTADEWRKSVDRVECLRRIAATGNHNLDGPLSVTAYGSGYTIS